MLRGTLLAGSILLAAGPRAAELPFERSEVRSACDSHTALRQPYFGDLHVHTLLSLDASTQGTVTRPADAYRFARGERIGVQPYDARGVPLRSLQLERPLDFAAVTDHSELLGEWNICNSEDRPGHDSWVCMIYRRWPRVAYFQMNLWANRARRFAFCGPGGRDCLEAAREPWQEIRDAAEAAYDRSPACSFTTFVAYEWTGAFGPGNNAHRNVIFRNRFVPELPKSYIDAPSPPELWRSLREDCTEAESGCDVLVIPHNSNLSNGLMFRSVDDEGRPIGIAEARGRAELEVLVEVMQHKGSSECMLGVDTADELCGFENLATSNFTAREVSFLREPHKPRQFVRHILKEGPAIRERLGVNPFKFGMIGSTDTHLSAPGSVSESAGYPGHGGAGPPAREEIPPGLPDAIDFNPGGLAVLWAEENSRDALFAAMRRREAYGTSGPRHVLRFFAGWDLPEDLCVRNDLVEQGYRSGVPMGGDLPPQAGPAIPRFVVSALADPGTAASPGLPLQRVQIIKGWLEGDELREAVYDIAGDAANGASVELSTCRPVGPVRERKRALCGVWTDSDFDPARPAFYYARVLENPSCRWSTRICLARGVDCSEPASIGEGLDPCCDPLVPKTVQERSWSSPIWYTPAGSRTGVQAGGRR